MQFHHLLASMGLYGLPPLRSDQIRLLRVGLEDDGTIRCTITIHGLCDRPQNFSALSYTWGPCQRGACNFRRPVSSTASSRVALCNNERENVTENLYDFLYQWGSSHDWSAYLWIDAICIDQHNISERSHQVNIMGQIYTAARQVLIWLGPDYESTSSAFELMGTLVSLTSDGKAALNCHDVSTHNANPSWTWKDGKHCQSSLAELGSAVPGSFKKQSLQVLPFLCVDHEPRHGMLFRASQVFLPLVLGRTSSRIQGTSKTIRLSGTTPRLVLRLSGQHGKGLTRIASCTHSFVLARQYVKTRATKCTLSFVLVVQTSSRTTIAPSPKYTLPLQSTY